MEGEPQISLTERERLIAEKAKDGWQLVGREQLFRDSYNSDLSSPVRFVITQYQTEEEIRERYREQFRQQARGQGMEEDFDIELVPVPPETFQGEPLSDQYKKFFVFARFARRDNPDRDTSVEKEEPR